MQKKLNLEITESQLKLIRVALQDFSGDIADNKLEKFRNANQFDKARAVIKKIQKIELLMNDKNVKTKGEI